MLQASFNLIGYKSKLESPTLIGNINEVVVPNQPCEHFRSVYRFDSSIAALPSLASLPSGTKGYADMLVLDLDSHTDLDGVHADALSICKSLDVIKAKYELYFSGGKGFHVCIPTSQFGFEPTSDPDILKRMAEAIAGSVKTWDSSVYNLTRIFRTPNTFNEKGGFYKHLIPNPYDADLADVKEMSKGPAWDNIETDYSDLALNEALVKLYEACKVRVNRVVQENVRENSTSLFVKVGEGGRNEAAYTLTRKLARRGHRESDAEFIVQSWNKQLPKPLPYGEITKVVQSAYTKGMNEFVDEGTFANHLYEIGRAIEECSLSFSKEGQGAFLTGYEFFDKLSGGYYPGEVIALAARSGNFKTCLLENILQKGSQKAQRPVLFFSMEMPNNTLTLRRVQKSYGLTKKEAIEWVKGKNDRSKLIEDWKWVKTCYLSNLGIEEMLGLVDFYTETFGPLAAVGIDYLGLCKGTNNNREKTARMATDIKTRLARAANAPVFLLTQAKQIYEGERGSIELDRSCNKDSDTVLDSMDYSFGIWKKWILHEGVKDFLIFGKPLKDRGLDYDAYGTSEPYFWLDLDKPRMDLRDVHFATHVPVFDKLKDSKERGNDE